MENVLFNVGARFCKGLVVGFVCGGNFVEKYIRAHMNMYRETCDILALFYMLRDMLCEKYYTLEIYDDVNSWGYFVWLENKQK